jgi:predicted nucleic acid-binding protein
MSGVVSNAGPLITLGKLNLLHILSKLYSHVFGMHGSKQEIKV